MLPFKLVYHDGYDLNLGSHVFPSQKFRLIRDRLLADGFAEPSDFVQPEPATDDDLMLVHERGWITRLKHGTLDYLELMKLEIPYSQKMVNAFWLAAGGTILAARLALRGRRRIQYRRRIPSCVSGTRRRILRDPRCRGRDPETAAGKAGSNARWWSIAMCMTATARPRSLRGTRAVFTLSIHQFNNYPTREAAFEYRCRSGRRSRRRQIISIGWRAAAARR